MSEGSAHCPPWLRSILRIGFLDHAAGDGDALAVSIAIVVGMREFADAHLLSMGVRVLAVAGRHPHLGTLAADLDGQAFGDAGDDGGFARRGDQRAAFTNSDRVQLDFDRLPHAGYGRLADDVRREQADADGGE